eukprot:353951-Chlamydomonas_euryale.AAC.1
MLALRQCAAVAAMRGSSVGNESSSSNEVGSVGEEFAEPFAPYNASPALESQAYRGFDQSWMACAANSSVRSRAVRHDAGLKWNRNCSCWMTAGGLCDTVDAIATGRPGQIRRHDDLCRSAE